MERCPTPSDHESRYPFSGVYVGDSTQATLCLYQQDVRTVQGRLTGTPAVGQVSRDGTLMLAVGNGGGVSLYFLSLRSDTLTVNRRLSSGTSEAQLPDSSLVRSSSE